MKDFEKRLQNKGYAANDEEKHLSEVKVSDRKASREPGCTQKNITEAPLMSYREGKSLKDAMVRAKL